MTHMNFRRAHKKSGDKAGPEADDCGSEKACFSQDEEVLGGKEEGCQVIVRRRLLRRHRQHRLAKAYQATDEREAVRAEPDTER